MPASRSTILLWQLLVGIAVLALWQGLVSLKLLDPFFVSRPTAIAQRVVDVGCRAARCGRIWRRRSRNRCSASSSARRSGISLGFALARSPLRRAQCSIPTSRC